MLLAVAIFALYFSTLLTQSLRQAHAETTYALDFISLLLSKHTPRQAEISMSPYLKQNAPLGSLGVDVIKTPQQSVSAKRDIDVVSRGWKLESFNSAANKLLKSATRLEKEVAAETKYWAEVLAVKEKGWNVCRLPRERQTLGVQFGFIEGISQLSCPPALMAVLRLLIYYSLHSHCRIP